MELSENELYHWLIKWEVLKMLETCPYIITYLELAYMTCLKPGNKKKTLNMITRMPRLFDIC